MVPGLEVEQINSNTWAITSRGFNNQYANKLLVLIDGRTVYDPNNSDVRWNSQNVFLEDVERIEVIRGPGGTLWGANAVNGVINIISKKAKDSQGLYVMGGGGTHDRLLDGFRYGGQVGDDFHYRFYGQDLQRGPGEDPSIPGSDAWQFGQCGFRADWEPDHGKTDTLTVQGDQYQGSTGENADYPLDAALPATQSGENVLLRWRHICNEDSDWQLQTYYDRFSYATAPQVETATTFDVEFQYRFPLGDRQKITCGADYRNVESVLPRR